jgi:hypothetical protein
MAIETSRARRLVNMVHEEATTTTHPAHCTVTQTPKGEINLIDYHYY